MMISDILAYGIVTKWW